MEIYVKKIMLFPYFLFFFWFSNMILSDALILPVPQFKTQQVMSQIRSHIEYLYIVFLFSFFQSKLMKNIALPTGLNTI